MKKGILDINFSALGLTLFLLITFSFSTHAFCAHRLNNINTHCISAEKSLSIKADNSDLNASGFISEVEEEEVEETEHNHHLQNFIVSAIFIQYHCIFHSNESESFIQQSNKFIDALEVRPAFIKNCTYLI